jgi:hypothetical protein
VFYHRPGNDEKRWVLCRQKKKHWARVSESVSHRYNLKASPQALQCHITKAHLCHRSQGWVGPFRHLRARSQQLPRCGEWIVTVSSRCSFYPNSFAKVPRGAHDSWWPARPKLTTLWFDLNINHHQPIGKPPTNIPLKKEKQKGTKKINTKSSMMPLRPEAWDLINLSPLRCSKSPLLLWGRAVPRETHSLRLESSLSEAFPAGSIPFRTEKKNKQMQHANHWLFDDMWMMFDDLVWVYFGLWQRTNFMTYVQIWWTLTAPCPKNWQLFVPWPRIFQWCIPACQWRRTTENTSSTPAIYTCIMCVCNTSDNIYIYVYMYM